MLWQEEAGEGIEMVEHTRLSSSALRRHDVLACVRNTWDKYRDMAHVSPGAADGCSDILFWRAVCCKDLRCGAIRQASRQIVLVYVGFSRAHRGRAACLARDTGWERAVVAARAAGICR